MKPECKTNDAPVVPLRRSARLSSRTCISSPQPSCPDTPGALPPPGRRTKMIPDPNIREQRHKKNKKSGGYYLNHDNPGPGDFFRDMLHIDLIQQAPQHCYGPEMEQRICILPSGETFTWEEKTSGTTWIALRMGEPYTVTVMDTMPGLYQQKYSPELHPTAHTTGYTILAEMGYKFSAFNKMVAPRTKRYKPFAVVSVAPGTVGDSDESEHGEHGVSRAVNYLKDIVMHRPGFTFEGICQIGVCALKHLFGPKFESHQPRLYSYEGPFKNHFCGPVGSVNECLDEFLYFPLYVIDRRLYEQWIQSQKQPTETAAIINQTTTGDHHLATIEQPPLAAASTINQTTCQL